MARFFCIFHALSFELNFLFDRRFPLTPLSIFKMDFKSKMELLCSPVIFILQLWKLSLKNVYSSVTEITGYVVISGGGGGGGERTCICHDTGICHYFGYFLGVLPDFWVPPRFLGTFLGYSRILGYHFLGKI